MTNHVFTGRAFKVLSAKIAKLPSAHQRRYFARLFAEYFFKGPNVAPPSFDVQRWFQTCKAPMADADADAIDRGKYVYIEPRLDVVGGQVLAGLNTLKNGKKGDKS